MIADAWVVDDVAGATPAEDRVTILFARVIGAGYALYLVLLVPGIVDLAPRMASWWTPVAVVSTFGPGLAVGLVTLRRRPDPQHSRFFGIAAWAGYMLSVAIVPSAWHGPKVPADVELWFNLVHGHSGMAAALAFPNLIAVGCYLSGAVMIVQAVFLAHGPAGASPIYSEAAFAMLCLVFVGGTIMMLRAGRLADEATRAIHEAGAAAAAAEAREAERERLDALTHDHVLATLLSAARLDAVPAVAAQARDTLSRLGAAGETAGTGGVLPAAAALAELRGVASSSDERVVFRGSAEGGVVAPAEVVRTLGAAMSEAVRNSVRHAGVSATCVVDVRFGAAELAVTIADDGLGFDPARVPPGRMGVLVSILARVRRLDGGTAHVVSAPGGGTEVRLTWRR